MLTDRTTGDSLPSDTKARVRQERREQFSRLRYCHHTSEPRQLHRRLSEKFRRPGQIAVATKIEGGRDD
jgi:hypothetical protein